MLIARIIAMALSRLDRDPMLTLDHALADIHDFQSGESAVMNDVGQSAASSSSVLHRLFEKDLEQTVETTRRLMMDVFAGDVRANQRRPTVCDACCALCA